MEPHGTFEDFQNMLLAESHDLRCDQTWDDWDTKRVVREEQWEEVALNKATNPPTLVFPFRPVTPEGLHAWPREHDGTEEITEATFAAMAIDNPTALFCEVRALYITMCAWLRTCQDCHSLVTRLDANVELMTKWAKYFGERSEAPGGGALNQLVGEIGEKNAEIDALQRDLGEVAAAQLAATRDATQARQELQAARQEAANRQGQAQREIKPQSASPIRETPGVHSDVSEGGTRRSGKLPDPPQFRGDEKDEISFEVWHRALNNKITVNCDLFHDNRAVMAYIEGRVAGPAAEGLAPYLRSYDNDNSTTLTTATALMHHLWEEYHDPNRRENAIQEFAKLSLKSGEDYHKFRSAFIRLAGEAGKARKEWKAEFKRKLYPTLQNALVT
jgi:outer membrane murein-binding lipoprotein Lpp